MIDVSRVQFFCKKTGHHSTFDHESSIVAKRSRFFSSDHSQMSVKAVCICGPNGKPCGGGAESGVAGVVNFTQEENVECIIEYEVSGWLFLLFFNVNFEEPSQGHGLDSWTARIPHPREGRLLEWLCQCRTPL